MLGNQKAADLLQEILEEEKGANDALTRLARATSNEEALDKSGDNGSEDETGQKPESLRRGISPAGTDRNRVGAMLR